MKEKFDFKFNWVLVNKIAIGSRLNTKDDIDILIDNKIKSILTLCNEREDPEFYTEVLPIKIERYELPDHRYKSLPSIGDIEKVLELMTDLSYRGPFFVHCFASMERAPLVCLAWLVKKENLKPIEALTYLMQIHPGTSPIPEQLDLLKLL